MEDVGSKGRKYGWFLGLLMVLGLGVSVGYAATGAQAQRMMPKSADVNTDGAPCGSWEAVNSPNPALNGTFLFGMEAISTTDVWAVGHYITTVFPQPEVTDSLTMHWNGTEWEIIPSPNPSSLHNWIYDAAAVAPDDVWAVGSWLNQSNGNALQLGMHWDGTEWSLATMPGIGQLNAVSAVGPNDVWAVGSGLDGTDYKITAAHWNGTAWSEVALPDPGTAESFGFSVKALSASDVWVVGRKGEYPNYASMILHWNGAAWSEVTHPDVGVLWSVDGVAANDVWTVGGNSLHWDGTAWSEEDLALPDDTQMAGVAMVSSNDVWATGYYVTGSGTVTLMRHWDGNDWTDVPSFNTSIYNVMTGIDVASATEVWAVGHSSVGGGAPYYSMTGGFTPDAGCPTPTSTHTPTQTSVVTVTNTATASRTGTATSTATATATVTVCAVEFSDVPVGSTFYAYVNCMACRGIVAGYPDGTFRPNALVTRGQISKMVSQAAGFSEPPGGQVFEDVPVGSTFYDWINRLANREVMTGYACGGAGEPCVGPSNRPYFRPGTAATRGQISKIVYEAAGFTGAGTGQSFQDVPPTHTFYEWVEGLASRGIVGGYACGGEGEPCVGPANLPYFRPQVAVTRGQASKLVSSSFFPECAAGGRK